MHLSDQSIIFHCLDRTQPSFRQLAVRSRTLRQAWVGCIPNFPPYPNPHPINQNRAGRGQRLQLYTEKGKKGLATLWQDHPSHVTSIQRDLSIDIFWCWNSSKPELCYPLFARICWQSQCPLVLLHGAWWIHGAFRPLPLELPKLEMMVTEPSHAIFCALLAGRGSKDDGRCALVAVPALFQWLSHKNGS